MSIRRVERDLNRFRQIVRGKIKKDLRKYMSQGEMIGRQGRKYVSIPLPQIDIPQFRYGAKQGGGVGQGDGDVGDPIGQGDPQDGSGEAGSEPGQHVIEVDITLEELAQILEDMRVRSLKETMMPESNAVIIYMMDVSGSMGTEQKELVGITAFWVETWLRSQYKEIEIRYIVHDAAAKEVDQETFYHIREGGGTKISSAYKLCNKLIDERYSPDEWNIYPFHFSDGDNWGGGDTRECVELLRSQLLPKSNQFCYGQVRSLYGSGRFAHDLEEYLGKEDNLVIAEIADRDDVYDAIKDFLGKGK